MNRKKLSVIFFVGFAIISGCGKSVSEIKDSNLVENDTLEGDITFSTEETSGASNEGFVQMSADELMLSQATWFYESQKGLQEWFQKKGKDVQVNTAWPLAE